MAFKLRILKEIRRTHFQTEQQLFWQEKGPFTLIAFHLCAFTKSIDFLIVLVDFFIFSHFDIGNGTEKQ